MTSLVLTPVRATTTPPTASLVPLTSEATRKAIADAGRRPPARRKSARRSTRHDDLSDVVDRCDQADAAHDEPGAVRLEHVPADVQIAVAHRRDDGAEGQVVLPKAIRIDVDLILLDVPADRGHFGHARHGVELVADEPVLKRAQFAQRVRRAFDRVPEDVADAGRIRSERGRHARRQRLRNEGSCARARALRAKYRSTPSSKMT